MIPNSPNLGGGPGPTGGGNGDFFGFPTDPQGLKGGPTGTTSTQTFPPTIRPPFFMGNQMQANRPIGPMPPTYIPPQTTPPNWWMPGPPQQGFGNQMSGQQPGWGGYLQWLQGMRSGGGSNFPGQFSPGNPFGGDMKPQPQRQPPPFQPPTGAPPPNWWLPPPQVGPI